MGKGLLLVISGPSGVGKGTVVDILLKENENVKLSISATTRNKRPSEEHGVNYFFLSVNEFENLIKEGKMLEYANVHGNYYGTPRNFVVDEIEKGNSVILEIDVQGAMQVKENYPDAKFIFILPPSFEELENRIVNRSTEDEATIKLRMENAKKEMEYVDRYDYSVVNDEILDTVNKIKEIIEKEKGNY